MIDLSILSTAITFIIVMTGGNNLLRYLQGVPKKNVPVMFPVTTGTNTLGTWKTKTDMESLLSQLFIVYSVFILPLSNR